MGRPDFDNWPHFKEYPGDDKSYWLKDYEQVGLELAVPSLDETGLDLLQVPRQGLDQVKVITVTLPLYIEFFTIRSGA